jgi:hypothetical protein
MGMIERVITNKIKCLRCETVLESVHRHDFRWCKCGKVAVDGGKEYRRRLGQPTDYIDISEVAGEEFKFSWEK